MLPRRTGFHISCVPITPLRLGLWVTLPVQQSCPAVQHMHTAQQRGDTAGSPPGRPGFPTMCEKGAGLTARKSSVEATRLVPVPPPGGHAWPRGGATPGRESGGRLESGIRDSTPGSSYGTTPASGADACAHAVRETCRPSPSGL